MFSCLFLLFQLIYRKKQPDILYKDYWKKRNQNQVNKSISDFNHKNNELLTDLLKGLNQINNILEIGCGYGPKLILSAKKYHDKNFVGIDLNSNYVNNGNKIIKQMELKNVKLYAADATNIELLEETFDLIFFNAFFLYLNQKELEEVMNKIKKVSPKYLIIVELNNNCKYLNTIHGKDGYYHNYKKIIINFFPKCEIESFKLPKEYLMMGRWRMLGQIFICKLK